MENKDTVQEKKSMKLKIKEGERKNDFFFERCLTQFCLNSLDPLILNSPENSHLFLNPVGKKRTFNKRTNKRKDE